MLTQLFYAFLQVLESQPKRPYANSEAAHFYEVVTDLGTVYAHPNGLDAIYVTTNPQGRERSRLTVHGVPYGAGAHLQFADGRWGVHSSLVHLTRVDDPGKSASTHAIQRAQGTIERAVDQWVKDNPEAMRTGTLRALNNDVKRLDEKIAETAQSLSKLLDERDAAIAEEQRLQKEVATHGR